MSTNVVQLERLFRRGWDWSPRELAEFYRVESALIQAGLKIDTERGVSDEGDPWFAFCRRDDGEVIVHLARIGGTYILAGFSYEGVASGRDIGALIRELVDRHPLIQMGGGGSRQGSKIFLHPAALLIAVIATAFFKSTEARALTDDQKLGESRGGAAAPKSDSALVAESHKTIVMEAAQGAIILSAIISVLQSSQPVAADEKSSAPPVPTSLFPFSDDADVSFLSPAAAAQQHTISSVLTSVETQQGGQEHSAAAPATPLPHMVGIGEALPLIAVLWDLAENHAMTKTAETAAFSPSAATSTASIPASLESPPAQAPLLIFKLGLNDAKENLPVVQAVKISYSAAPGPDETHPVSHSDPLPSSAIVSDPLPSALVNAMQATTHMTIDGQLAGTSLESFANRLIDLANQPPSKPTEVPTKSDLVSSPAPASDHVSSTAPASHDSSSTQPAPSPNQTSAPASQSTHDPTPPPHDDLASLTMAVQDFLNQASTSTVVNNGKETIVYDTGALATHPTELQSVTYDFTDGSSLILVGMPANLPHLHLG